MEKNANNNALGLQEFIKIVSMYDSHYHAVYHGVGITHSFPPHGMMRDAWNNIIESFHNDHELHDNLK